MPFPRDTVGQTRTDADREAGAVEKTD